MLVAGAGQFNTGLLLGLFSMTSQWMELSATVASTLDYDPFMLTMDKKLLSF